MGRTNSTESPILDQGMRCVNAFTIRKPSNARSQIWRFTTITTHRPMLLRADVDLVLLWCPRRDSNPEPTDYESAALTVELQGHNNGNASDGECIRSRLNAANTTECTTEESYNAQPKQTVTPQCFSLTRKCSIFPSAQEDSNHLTAQADLVRSTRDESQGN